MITRLLFAGRFQPFHVGHLDSMQRLIEEHRPSELVLCVLGGVPDGFVDEEESDLRTHAQAHHVAERNPWPLTTTMAAAARICSHLVQAHPSLLAAPLSMPRMDLAWPFVERWIPAPRCWAVPQTIDAFSMAKRDFFLGHGDEVVLFDEQRITSGEFIRSSMAAGDPLTRTLIPDLVHDIYFR